MLIDLDNPTLKSQQHLVLLREGTTRKVFANNYARKRHTSCFVVIYN